MAKLDNQPSNIEEVAVGALARIDVETEDNNSINHVSFRAGVEAHAEAP